MTLFELPTKYLLWLVFVACTAHAEMVTIPAPEPSQRLRIIQQTVADLCKKTNQQIGLGLGVAERLPPLREGEKLPFSQWRKVLQRRL
jgi:hypothetical protein